MAPLRSDALVATAISMIGFAVAWLVVIWLAYSQVFGPVDTALGTALPQRYGHDVLVGKLPYAGFGFEYPPLALPTFVLPALVVGPSASAFAYRTAFEGVSPQHHSRGVDCSVR